MRAPYSGDGAGQKLGILRRWTSEFGGVMRCENFFAVFGEMLVRAPEYTLSDKFNYFIGAIKSFEDLWDEIMTRNLFRQARSFEMPVYVFQEVSTTWSSL